MGEDIKRFEKIGQNRENMRKSEIMREKPRSLGNPRNPKNWKNAKNAKNSKDRKTFSKKLKEFERIRKNECESTKIRENRKKF